VKSLQRLLQAFTALLLTDLNLKFMWSEWNKPGIKPAVKSTVQVQTADGQLRFGTAYHMDISTSEWFVKCIDGETIYSSEIRRYRTYYELDKSLKQHYGSLLAPIVMNQEAQQNAVLLFFSVILLCVACFAFFYMLLSGLAL
jgi:hypothetical protein